MVLPKTMHAVLLNGHGGLEQLEYRTDIVVPTPKSDEVLIQVTAAGVNNTDINTRIGWYSKTNEQATNTGGTHGLKTINDDDASWSGQALAFPFIQGADCCGRIVAVGSNVDSSRIGERVIVRTMLRSYVNYKPYACWTFGSECNGGFAQFTVAPSREAYKVNSDWTDEELASIPCSYSTAENMLHRINLGAETVLITGSSGGVGSAAVQLAKRRGATVIGLCSESKADEVLACGADRVINRNANLMQELGKESVDVVIDLIGGEQWPSLLEVLRKGGRYSNAGAIAGPISQIDLRTVYLNDLTLMGCTFQEDEVFTNLISYIENNEIRPLVAKTFPLHEISKAQEEFLTKRHLGKLVLIVPPIETSNKI